MHRLLRCLSCLLPCAVLAQPATLRACYERWQPYAYMESGHATGAAVEAIEPVFAGLGYRVDYQEMPYARCLSLANAGQIDLVLFSSSDRTRSFKDNHVALAYWLLAAFVPADSPQTHYDSPLQFKGLRVGVVNGYSYELLPSDGSLVFDQAPDPEANLRKLAAHHVDVVFEDLLWGRALADREGLAIRALHPLAKSEPNYLGFAPRLQPLIARFDAALAEHQQRGELDRIYRRYFGLSYRELSQLR